MVTIRRSAEADLAAVLAIINDAAQIYRGVIPTTQRSRIGTRLLRHVESFVDKPILIGTWAAASWAIAFYRRNGFVVVPDGDKDRLLRRYWSIPERQIETSVVLAKEGVKQ